MTAVEGQRKADKMVERKAVAETISKIPGISFARATMLVDIAAADLELPAGALRLWAAGEVEAIASRKAARYLANVAAARAGRK